MLEKIIELLDSNYVFDDQLIVAESDLRSDLYMEDDDMQNLVLTLEDEFNLDLSDVDPDYLFTVEDVVNLITKRTNDE